MSECSSSANQSFLLFLLDFWPSDIWPSEKKNVFVVKAVSEALCSLVPFGRRCISSLLKGFPRSGHRSVHAFLVRWCLAVLIYTSCRLIINWSSVSSSKTCFEDNELTQTVMDTGQRWQLTLLTESTSLQNPSFSLNVLQLETGHS